MCFAIARCGIVPATAVSQWRSNAARLGRGNSACSVPDQGGKCPGRGTGMLPDYSTEAGSMPSMLDFEDMGRIVFRPGMVAQPHRHRNMDCGISRDDSRVGISEVRPGLELRSSILRTDRAAGHSTRACAARPILALDPRSVPHHRPSAPRHASSDSGRMRRMLSSRPGTASATSAANIAADMPSCSNFKSPCLRSRADIPTATWIAHPWHDTRNSGSPNTHLIHLSTGNETRTWTNRHRPNHRRPQPRGGQT